MNGVFSQRPGSESLNSACAVLGSNPAHLSNSYVIYHTDKGMIETICDDCKRVQYTRSIADQECIWLVEIDEQIQLLIRIHSTENEVLITWQVKREGPEEQLVTVRLEGLIAAETRDPYARMALPAHGGRLIDPLCCTDGQVDHRYNWILDSFGSCAFVYTRFLAAALQVTSMDDMITSRIGGEKKARYAQLGVLLRHRYTKLDSSYRRAKHHHELSENLGENYPIEEDFVVPCGQVKIMLTECDDLPVKAGWVPAARMIYRQLPAKRSDFYHDYMVYKIFIGSPTDGIQTTWMQALEIIRNVWLCTAGIKQLVYLVGFQNNGHDDRYPDVFTANAEAGTENELRELVKSAAEKYNAIVSFHDNYDDVYKESAGFDADIVGRDNQGGLLKGGVWNGKQAYWVSLPQYAKEKAMTRIRKTLMRYPFLKDTYHLDVLTASVFRLDFRKGDPAGRQRDLEGRLQIIDQFAEMGVDVSSEACGLPFIGKISYFWYMQRVPRCLYEGDERIPLVLFLAHGKADYGGTHTNHPSEILDGLLYGGFYCNDVTAATPLKELTDAAFMLFMPLNRIRNDNAIAYKEERGWKSIQYDSGAVIAVNFETQECRVDIGGKRLIENGTAMIDQPDGTIVLYVAWEEPYMPVCMACSLSVGTAVEAISVSNPEDRRKLMVEGEGLRIDLPIGKAYRIQL